MAVRIRLSKRGRKKLALYDIVVSDSKSPRDGKFIQKLGTYNPNTNPATVVLNDELAFDWVMKGALPTDTARTIISERGVMLKKHLQIGVNKGAITQEAADQKFAAWVNQKDADKTKAASALSGKKDADKKARLAAEVKVKEAKAEQVRAKKIVASNPVAAADVAEAGDAAAEETAAE
ncbi:30S ribosomal protein S16 [Cytophaga aurantiaca]|uniref:30S ribosomal protein S16 n=1 Tax=Cytophaga aurantiaca TaxID=29530 RepID=UPI000366A43E|nr:30S ribosomal protein S16 [Cytophaga aurantiaca]